MIEVIEAYFACVLFKTLMLGDLGIEFGSSRSDPTHAGTSRPQATI